MRKIDYTHKKLKELLVRCQEKGFEITKGIDECTLVHKEGKVVNTMFYIVANRLKGTPLASQLVDKTISIFTKGM